MGAGMINLLPGEYTPSLTTRAVRNGELFPDMNIKAYPTLATAIGKDGAKLMSIW